MAHGKSHNYYDILGLPRSASEEEIRKQYLDIMRTLHPDKSSRRSSGSMDRFHEVQAAWRCLSDATRRLMYDLRTFGPDATRAADMGEMLLSRQKDQAALDLRNMEVEFQRILLKEQKKHGVLVKQALYGNLQLRAECLHEVLQTEKTIRPEDLQGPWIDVTTAVQCLVEQSSIVVHGNATSSKADLPGFYNPTALNSQIELSLYVLYDFREKLHEVTVEDRDTLAMPLRKHLVEALPRGPFPSSNVELLLRRRQLETSESPRTQPDGTGTPQRPRFRRLPRSAEEELHRAVRRHTVLRMQGPSFRAAHREFRLMALSCVAAVVVIVLAKAF